MIDLHMHTTASDGRCSPRELVDRCSAAGVTVMAVTDHDTIASISEIQALAAARGIEAHALQVLPVIALLLWRRRIEDARRVRLMLVAGGSYAAVFSILIWQALRGQAFIAPDAFTLAALGLWIALTAGLAVWPFRTRPSVGSWVAR